LDDYDKVVRNSSIKLVTSSTQVKCPGFVIDQPKSYFHRSNFVIIV